MRISILPLLSDNYCYLVFPGNTLSAWLVDPAISSEVISHLNDFLYHFPKNDKENKYTPISTVLITHRHFDHCGQTNQLVDYLNQRNKENGYHKAIEVVMGVNDQREGGFNWVTKTIADSDD